MSIKIQADHAMRYWPLYAAVVGGIIAGVTFKVQAEERLKTIEGVVVEQSVLRADVITLKVKVDRIQRDIQDQGRVLQQILMQTRQVQQQ